jgi:hypothetical protein
LSEAQRYEYILRNENNDAAEFLRHLHGVSQPSATGTAISAPYGPSEHRVKALISGTGLPVNGYRIPASRFAQRFAARYSVKQRPTLNAFKDSTITMVVQKWDDYSSRLYSAMNNIQDVKDATNSNPYRLFAGTAKKDIPEEYKRATCDMIVVSEDLAIRPMRANKHARSLPSTVLSPGTVA